MLSRMLVLVCASVLATGCAISSDNEVVADEMSRGDSLGAGHTELLAHDPLRSTYDFIQRAYGGVIQDAEVKNGGRHIDFGGYYPGELTVGIQGGETGILLDLGSDDEVADAVAEHQTVGGGQGYAAFALIDGRFNFEPANRALDGSPLGWSENTVNHLAPKVGHLYVMRIVDEHEPTDIVVKFLVVALDEPEGAIHFEWTRMR